MSEPAAVQLGAMLPALLDMLGTSGTAVQVVADRGDGLERIYANRPAAALLGFELEELLLLPPIEMVVPEQRAFVRELSTRFRLGPPVPSTLGFTGLHKDGRYLGLDLAIGHLRIPDGIVYVMGMRDVAIFEHRRQQSPSGGLIARRDSSS